MLHIGSGLFEVFRHNIAVILRFPSNVKPEFIDLVACAVQATTSLVLAKTILRGGRTTRPTYQSGAVTRYILSLLAFTTQSAPALSQSHQWLYLHSGRYFAAHVLRFDRVEKASTIYAKVCLSAAYLRYWKERCRAAYTYTSRQ